MHGKYKLFHNDLFNTNVCIDENNKIRLIDFDKTSSEWLPLNVAEKKRMGIEFLDEVYLYDISQGVHKW